MTSFLLLTAIVIFACVFLNRVSDKLGIPVLLAFILLGMFFGSDGPVNIAFENYNFAEEICSTALIFIMFYGGFGTNWSMGKACRRPCDRAFECGRRRDSPFDRRIHPLHPRRTMASELPHGVGHRLD